MTPDEERSVVRAFLDELRRVGEYGRVEVIVTAGRVSRMEGTRQTLFPAKEQKTLEEAA